MNQYKPFLSNRLREVEYLLEDVEIRVKFLELERVKLLRTINRIDKGLPLLKGWTFEEKDLKCFLI